MAAKIGVLGLILPSSPHLRSVKARFPFGICRKFQVCLRIQTTKLWKPTMPVRARSNKVNFNISFSQVLLHPVLIIAKFVKKLHFHFVFPNIKGVLSVEETFLFKKPGCKIFLSAPPTIFLASPKYGFRFRCHLNSSSSLLSLLGVRKA